MLVLPLAVSALAAGCATTARTARTEPTGPKVVDLDIQGAEQLSPRAIKRRILTSETPWWEPLWPFVGPSRFDPQAWQADLQRIERFYQAEGYYEAQVLEARVEPKDEDEVALEVRVEEGEPTRVASLEARGLEALPEPERAQVLEALPLVQGERFREEEWVRTKEQLQQRLRERGYAEAQVGGRVQVDLVTHEAAVELEVAAGQRYRFGQIFVATNPDPQVPPERIREQAQAVIKQGDWYSESALAEAQARVYRMGVFSAVSVSRGAPDREAGTVPVVVDVREAPFRSIRLGGGVLVDASRQEARALAEWSHRNVYLLGLGGLGRFTVSGRVGYVFLPSVWSPTFGQGPVFQGSAEFAQPRFLARDLRLQTSLALERGQEQAFRFYSGRLQAGVAWQPRPAFSFFPSYNLELSALSGRQVGRTESLPTLALGCPEPSTANARCLLWLSYLEQVLEWDRRDTPLDTREGLFLGLSLQEGGGPLLGSFSFLRVLPELRAYRSFGPGGRLTVAARLRVGTLLAPLEPLSCPPGPDGAPLLERGLCLQRTPIINRFFSGGQLMRGFSSTRLAPMQAVLDESGNLTSEVVPVGGDGLFESSLELRYRPSDTLTLAAFYDTGLVSRGPLRFGDQTLADGTVVSGLFGNRHYQAVGLGAGYSLLGILIRVDLAVRLDVGAPLFVSPVGDYVYPERGLCFGLGPARRTFAGAPEGLCTFHVSIGQAF